MDTEHSADLILQEMKTMHNLKILAYKSNREKMVYATGWRLDNSLDSGSCLQKLVALRAICLET